MKNYSPRQTIIFALIAACLLVASTISIISTQATSSTVYSRLATTAMPFHVTLSVSNFSNQTLAASADDVSDPTHAMFSLQNGSSLWYGLTIQSNPTSLTPTVANPTTATTTGDLVTATFFGTTPLLPPVGILPFDQTSKGIHYETLRLMAAFSTPNQQIQITLSPFEPHAISLDIYSFLLHLLGENAATSQIGLLAPDVLQDVFNISGTMKDFSNVTNDYVQILQAAPDKATMLGHAYDFSQALINLLTDEGEQHVLSDMLWKILGKTIPYSAILKSLISFTSVQFGLGIEGFMRDEALVLAPTLPQQNTPTVLLQSVVNTAQPTSTMSATPATATPVHSAIPSSTVTPPLNRTPTPPPPYKPTPTQTVPGKADMRRAE